MAAQLSVLDRVPRTYFNPMKLSVYADESGTHEGSDFSLLAGWIAGEDFWGEFIPAWQAILNKYNVKHFHFTEFAEASSAKRNSERKPKKSYETNTLKHLSLDELDSFYLECSLLLASPKLEFEVAILERKKFFDAKAKPEKIYPSEIYERNPECYLIDDFVKRCANRILKMWGTTCESITFIFDKRSNREWEQTIKDVVANYARWKWPLNPVHFKDKTEALPIQAADMLAFRGNQISRNVANKLVLEKPSVLDLIIGKRMAEESSLRPRDVESFYKLRH